MEPSILETAHALVIGIAEYAASGVPTLPETVENDARDVREALIGPVFFW